MKQIDHIPYLESFYGQVNGSAEAIPIDTSAPKPRESTAFKAWVLNVLSKLVAKRPAPKTNFWLVMLPPRNAPDVDKRELMHAAAEIIQTAKQRNHSLPLRIYVSDNKSAARTSRYLIHALNVVRHDAIWLAVGEEARSDWPSIRAELKDLQSDCTVLVTYNQVVERILKHAHRHTELIPGKMYYVQMRLTDS